MVGVFVFFGLLVFAIGLHEFGHFITARMFGIKVSQFFIGFGPTLFSRRGGPKEVVEDEDGELKERGELEYGVKLLPLGGYVKIVGMSLAEDVTPQDAPRSFARAKIWQRAVVLVAGSATHIVSAFLVFFLVLSVIGFDDPSQTTLVVEAVVTDSPAQQAGIEPGDKLVEIDGNELENFEELRTIVQASASQTLAITVETDSVAREVSVLVPGIAGVSRGQIGIASKAPHVRLSPQEGLGRSAQAVGAVAVLFVRSTPKLFDPQSLGLTGETLPDEERPASIVGAGQAAASAAERGFETFLLLFATITLAIGLFNLLPLLPLDGGHLLFLGIEKIFGRAVSPRIINRVTIAGLGLLLIIGFALIFQDIRTPLNFSG